MTTITQKEFNKLVSKDVKSIQKEFKKLGSFWPAEEIKDEVESKLKSKYKIVK